MGEIGVKNKSLVGDALTAAKVGCCVLPRSAGSGRQEPPKKMCGCCGPC